jgi:hypothetical protein
VAHSTNFGGYPVIGGNAHPVKLKRLSDTCLPVPALLFAKRHHSGAAVDTATGEARDLKSYLTPNGQRLRLRAMWLAILCLLASGMCPSMTQPQAPAGVPVIKITKEDSSIKFHVKASVAIDGTIR